MSDTDGDPKKWSRDKLLAEYRVVQAALKSAEGELEYLRPFLGIGNQVPFCHHCRDWHRTNEEHIIPLIKEKELV